MIFNLNDIALKAKELAFDALFAQLPVGFYWMDSEGILLGCNEVILKNLNLTIEKFVGKHAVDLTSKQAWENSKAVMTTCKNITVEEIHEKLDGEKITYLSIKSPIQDSNNRVIGLLGISIDITERKRMEAELYKAKEKAEAGNRSKDAFILNMAHDIRTPLTGMIHMSEDLREMVANNEEALQRAQLLEQSSRRLHELLESVLELSKAEYIHEDEIKKETIDLRKMVHNLRDLMLPSIKSKGLVLKIDLDAEIPNHLETDRLKLERILLNLTANAIKFTEKGEINVSFRCLSKQKDKARIELCIRDTGIGIPSDQRAKIFDRFVKVHPSYRGLYKGHGVGLFIVKQYVEALGGTITVESSLGQGTTFTIVLELSIATELDRSDQTETVLKPEALENLTVQKVQELTQQKTDLSGSSQRILLIEDDLAARLGAQSRLKQSGYQVATAENAVNALKILKEKEFDLILSDIGLPDGDGMELTQQYRVWEKRNRKNRIPIVALTGHAGEEAKEKYLASGMDRVFVKPLKESDIKEIQTILEQAKPKALSSYPLFDEAQARTLFDETDLKDIIQVALQSWDEELVILREAHAQQNWKKIAFQAHKLKGGSTYVGASRLNAVCTELGSVLSEQDQTTPEDLFQQLVQIVEETHQLLQRWLKN